MDHAVKDCPFSTKTDMECTLEVVFTACIPKASSAGGQLEHPIHRGLPQVERNAMHTSMVPLPARLPGMWGRPSSEAGAMRCKPDSTRVEFNYKGHTCRSSRSNMLSAQEHTQVIRDYLATECAEGRVVGPLTPAWAQAMQISRFGVIPKGSNGKWRLILDLSSPDGASVNSGIDKGLCSLTYASVDEAARHVIQLGWGALMVKVDIKVAYQLVRSTQRTAGEGRN